MSLQYMILGTLMERPYHGYQLKSNMFQKVFVDFGINDGQLYPTLKKLEQGGLIEKTVELQEGSPNRHIYSITEKGKEDFFEWLQSNKGEEISFRYDFIRKDPFFIRCNYIQYLDKDIAVNKVEEQIKVTKNAISELEQARDSMIKKEVSPLRINLLEYGLKSQEMRLNWLKEFLSNVEKINK